MKEYDKIQSIYKRDERGNFIDKEWSTPELEYLQNNYWIFTEKVDGTNIRIMWDGINVRFGGKTDNSQIPTILFAKLSDLFSKDKFIDYSPLCLYGEGYGVKIQKGGSNYISDGVNFVLFDVKIDSWWLKRVAVEDIACKLDIRCVPIIGYGTIHDAIELTKNGFKSVWGDFLAEGIVMRPGIELLSRNGNRIITKVKHKDFLQKVGSR